MTTRRGSGFLALFLVAAAACGPARQRPPDVVLVSIDTLRFDHVGLYGYERPTTPVLDALGADGLVFERAYSSASHTLPAHASILTGHEPRHHGLITSRDTLPDGIETLAQRLGQAGYETGAFVNAGYLHAKFGLARGFDVWDFEHNQRPRAGPDRQWGRNAAETNRAVGAWLAERPPEAPVLLFVHYYDVHSDEGRRAYDAPPSERARFALPGPPSPRLTPGEEGASLQLKRLDHERVVLDRDEREWLVSHYDAGIAYTDDALGELLALLRRHDRFDDTLLIVTADHGEEFQDHGRLLHEQVYEELVRVPLVIRLPAGLGEDGPRTGRIAGVVRHVDLVPSLLDWLGLPIPEGLAGRSLSPLLSERDSAPRVAVARNQRGDQVAVTDGRDKLVVDIPTRRSRLFDLERDPGETRDRAARPDQRARATVRRLNEARRLHLAREVPAPRPARPTPLDPSVAASLKALGYVEQEVEQQVEQQVEQAAEPGDGERAAP